MPDPMELAHAALRDEALKAAFKVLHAQYGQDWAEAETIPL